MRLRHPALLLAAAATLAAAGAAGAQPPAPDGAAPPSRDARRADWAARRQAHEAREVADLSTVLRLRPEQLASLRAWLDAGRPAPGELPGRGGGPDAMRRDPNAAPPTTAQSLDREAARMAERDGRMRAHLDATRRFYAGLSSEQQGVFDALQRLRHGGEHGGWGHRGGEPGGMKMGWRGRSGSTPPGAPPASGD